mgnify:CR=1 FL=1
MDSRGGIFFRMSTDDVRREAQATIARYRAERIARRRARAGVPGVSPGHVDDPGDKVPSRPSAGYPTEAELYSPVGQQTNRATGRSAQPAGIDPSPPGPDHLPTEALAHAAGAALASAADALRVAQEKVVALRSALGGQPAIVETGTLEHSGHGAGPELQPHVAHHDLDGQPTQTGFKALAVTTPVSDLGDLPGIGEGMVWHLQNAGIMSLHDLATADPTQLKTRLGKIGALGKIDEWIELARNNHNTAPPDIAQP